MVTYFNKKDLVDFGNFVLSEERKANVVTHPISKKDPEGVESRLKNVSHADLETFLSKSKKQDPCPTARLFNKKDL